MRFRRSAVPFAIAAALVVGACMVPGLDGEFEVNADPNTASSTSTSSSGDGTSGSTSSSGDGTTSSTSSGGDIDGGPNPSDAGKDTGTPGDTAFCTTAARAGITQFCSDFSLAQNAAGWGWADPPEQRNGTATFPGAVGAPARHLLAVVTHGNDRPGVSLIKRLAPGAIAAGKKLRLTLTFTLEKNVAPTPSTRTYANVALFKIGGTARGLSISQCGANPCAVDNDLSEAPFNDPTLSPGATLNTTDTFTAIVELTRLAGSGWKSVIQLKVGAAAPTTLATRNNDTSVGAAANPAIDVAVGATNAGDDNLPGTTGVNVDNVLVDLE